MGSVPADLREGTMEVPVAVLVSVAAAVAVCLARPCCPYPPLSTSTKLVLDVALDVNVGDVDGSVDFRQANAEGSVPLHVSGACW
jgi:hypothetical protein